MDWQRLASLSGPQSISDHVHGVPRGREDAGPPHQEGLEGPVEAGGLVPQDQPHVRDQVPQTSQL